MSSDDLNERLDALERRVAALEGRSAPAPAPTSDDVVTYHGRLSDPVELEWTIRVDPAGMLALPDSPRTDVLAALGHPARAAIVRMLAANGARPTAELQAAAGLGSTGQLYHHLKALTACGLVEQDKRGSYRLPPRAMVPALILLTAASDVAGQLRGDAP